jgi:hypothetical protein
LIRKGHRRKDKYNLWLSRETNGALERRNSGKRGSFTTSPEAQFEF